MYSVQNYDSYINIRSSETCRSHKVTNNYEYWYQILLSYRPIE
jgi:hypothetical protein